MVLRPATAAAWGVVIGAVTLSACSTPVASTCHSRVSSGPVPAWANTGFSPGATVPHVVGDEGNIVAVLFSQPLISTSDGSPPQNKVLLVAKEVPHGPTPVTIEARLSGSDVVVERQRPDGPGPGVLDLPQPGCWNLTLHWDGKTDTLALDYQLVPSSSR